MRNWNKLGKRSSVVSTEFEPTYEELKLFITLMLYFTFKKFEPTYEELKFYRWNKLGRRSKRLSLPMRNWNLNHRWLNKSWYLSLSLPMRNWNTKLPFGLKSLSICLSLPMRNWNIPESEAILVDDAGLSLPMRNWNIPWDMDIFLLILVWAYLWGIEIRAPGRERRYPHPVWAYLWGIEIKKMRGKIMAKKMFEPTYEELKLKIVISLEQAINRLSLPMRNWNTLATNTTPQFDMCLSLPMRNWNHMLALKEFFLPFVWAYLWGIEILSIGLITLSLMCLSLPMRNWNSVSIGSEETP